ncbi:MAG: hypothetical protein QM687_09340 [Ferruginibacter sp.]
MPDETGWTFNGRRLDRRRALRHRPSLPDLPEGRPDYTGRVTVPVLWDKQRQTIVNNESSEIIRMFNSAFDGLTGNEDDYYPAASAPRIDAINARIYDTVNNGVYKAGFATRQDAYEENVHAALRLTRLDRGHPRRQRLPRRRPITEADWRLFTTLRPLRRRLFRPLQVQHPPASRTTPTSRTTCAASSPHPACARRSISTTSRRTITGATSASTRRASSRSARSWIS